MFRIKRGDRAPQRFLRVFEKMEEYEYYLGHPFDSRFWVREWELKFEKKGGILLFNPFYDSKREDVIAIDAGRMQRYEMDEKKIVEPDLQRLENAKRGMIAVIDGSLSYGTIQEMVYARFYKKKVFSLITNGHEGHPWLKYHSAVISTNLEDLEMAVLEDFNKKSF